MVDGFAKQVQFHPNSLAAGHLDQTYKLMFLGRMMWHVVAYFNRWRMSSAPLCFFFLATLEPPNHPQGPHTRDRKNHLEERWLDQA